VNGKRRGRTGNNGKKRNSTGRNGKKLNLQTQQTLNQKSNPKHNQPKSTPPTPAKTSRRQTEPFFHGSFYCVSQEEFYCSMLHYWGIKEP
jgi:hypothetical protein